jgi:hypothetical protein
MKLRSLVVLFLTVVVFAAIGPPAMAGEKVVKRVPAGAVAFHFVLDLTYVPGPPELVGYMAFIEGVDSSLFDGEPSKDTAYFTFRITDNMTMPVDLPVEPDPELGVSMLPPGTQFTVFFNPYPTSRSWSNPGDFEQGEPIAVFEESALLSNTGSSASFNTFSSRLISSTPVYFKGQRINFKKLVPNGVTITNFGNGPRVREYFEPDFNVGSSAGATAIAIGE